MSPWEIDAPPPGEFERLSTEQLETIYRQIATEVRDLMHLLRGEDAP